MIEEPLGFNFLELAGHSIIYTKNSFDHLHVLWGYNCDKTFIICALTEITV